LKRLAASLALLLAACASTDDQGTVEGLVVDVQGDLRVVSEFTLLTEEGQMTFVPASDGDFAFPLPHLREHIISGVPVVVFWQDRGGSLVAVLVDDAGESGH
jgi:hypothetical protein